MRYTYYISDICLRLTSFQSFFIKDPTRVKLGCPDESVMVKQSVHPNNAGVVLNLSEYFVSKTLVKWMHKTLDFSVIGDVEHSIFWSYPVGYTDEEKNTRQWRSDVHMETHLTLRTLWFPTFCYAVAIDLLIISVTRAFKWSFSVCAIMRTRVKLQTFIYLWKEKYGIKSDKYLWF